MAHRPTTPGAGRRTDALAGDEPYRVLVRRECGGWVATVPGLIGGEVSAPTWDELKHNVRVAIVDQAVRSGAAERSVGLQMVVQPRLIEPDPPRGEPS